MAHTRWATHGPPSEVNSHPHRSDPKNSFLVVHNGIITNYRELKTVLEKKGYMFESETDTECIAKLFKYFYDSQRGGCKALTFTNLVKAVVKELVCFTVLSHMDLFSHPWIITQIGGCLCFDRQVCLLPSPNDCHS